MPDIIKNEEFKIFTTGSSLNGRLGRSPDDNLSKEEGERKNRLAQKNKISELKR